MGKKSPEFVLDFEKCLMVSCLTAAVRTQHSRLEGGALPVIDYYNITV